MSTTEQDEIYQDRILDHYEDPYHRGRPSKTTHAHEDDNPLCGDSVRLELNIEPSGRIAEAWFDGDGCCISQAAASMLTREIDGRPVEEVRDFTAQDMLRLFGARLTPNRQKCCLLSWRVLQAALSAPVTSPASPSKETPSCAGRVATEPTAAAASPRPR